MAEMQQQHPPQHHRGTPGRRRGNRHFANSPARKTYASENDMPTDVLFPISFGRESPFTPQKAGANSPAPGSQHNNSKSKPRSANKSRPKQAPSSPGPSKPGRSTPPQTATSKAAVATAFAGATFHASPAPSTLPIPSFLSKALDSPGLKDTDRASQEPSPPATDSEAPTPQPRTFLTDIAREESPLDIFFRADRAEKERARRASSANILITNPGPFSPPVQPTSPQEPRTLPNGLGTYRRRPTSQRNPSTGGISANELDGTPGRPMGPAFSTPYQDRIRAAARSSEKPTEPPQRGVPQQHQIQPQHQQQQATDDLSERLKRFLAVPMGSDYSPPNRAAQAPSPVTQGWAASAPQQGTIPPAAPAGADRGRPSELLHMEDSLRRMLKIGPTSNLGAAPPASYQSS